MQRHTLGHLYRMKHWMSHHNIYLYLEPVTIQEQWKHLREECGGILFSVTRVACDYRRKDFNEYTVFGMFTASLCGERNSQTAVYLIIAPCLCFSGVVWALVALLKGNLGGIIDEGDRDVKASFVDSPATSQAH